jgi:hypothetical protein
MPPADPIEYRILINLQDALQTITAGANYHYTVTSTAVKLDPNSDVDALIAPGGTRPFVIIQALAETWEYPEKPNGCRIVLPFRIVWVHESDITVDERGVQTYFKGIADVERAIAQDPGRNGLAVDTLIRQRQRFEDEQQPGSQVVAIVDVMIPVRRTYGLPNG